MLLSVGYSLLLYDNRFKPKELSFLQLFILNLGLKAPLDALRNSNGFATSNGPDTRKWLSTKFPQELEMYADVIRGGHSFIDQVH